MQYSITQIATVKSKVFAKIALEFNNVNTEEDLRHLINKYGIRFEEEPAYVDTHQMKILVFGSLSGKINEYKKVAKKMGISEKNIQFENDYSKLTNYDVTRLRYSSTYSDIIVGPNPHSVKGLGDNTNFIAMIQKNPSEYPRFIEAKSNSKLKITISSFKDALLETRYLEAIN